MNKYKCNNCGLESEMIPKEHGYFVNVICGCLNFNGSQRINEYSN